jgi:D-arabinose 1-dehydrogenase-like Zn-dependent alcohol dehydrogenase
MRMQAAGIHTFGGEVDMIEFTAPRSPAPDEVVIAVHAAGVGNWDEIVRLGNWDVGRRPPLALGVEAAGVIDAVGEQVTTLAPGEEVLTHPLPLRHQGAWAEWLVAPAALVARKPAAVPWETAAAFPVPALTADQALGEAAPAPAGAWVLVHGAGGLTAASRCSSRSREKRSSSRRRAPRARSACTATAPTSSSTITIPTGPPASETPRPAEGESRPRSTPPAARRRPRCAQ